MLSSSNETKADQSLELKVVMDNVAAGKLWNKNELSHLSINYFCTNFVQFFLFVWRKGLKNSLRKMGVAQRTKQR